MPADAAPRTYWNAAYRGRLASPLTPHRDDVANARAALQACTGTHLLLGVTPEYGALTESMVAIDRRGNVIADLWRTMFPGRPAVHANWLNLPFREQSFSAAIGDGCLNALAYPSQYGRMFEELRRVLERGGRLALRTFVMPEEAETCETVCEQAMRAAIGSFHAFKWRLAMAMLAESGEHDVAVVDIHKRFCALFPRRDPLAAAAGWTRADIDTIDAYPNSQIRLSFPTLAQLRRAFDSAFDEIELRYGNYELAQCCPLSVLQARR